MVKLTGRAVGDVLIEAVGPQDGVNCLSTDTTVIDVFLLGSGAVQVQENTTIQYRSDAPDLNPISRQIMPNPANWVDVSTAKSAGFNSVTLTHDATEKWYRVIVSTAGTGIVKIGARWPR